MVLRSLNALKPTSIMTYADVTIGLPNMIICIQLVPFAFLFHYAYGTKPYRVLRSADLTISQQHQPVDDDESGSFSNQRRYQGGPLGLYAWVAFFNPFEFFRETKSNYYMLREARVGSVDVRS